MLQKTKNTELVMLVGIPGSGKSFVSSKYRECGYAVHSSDAIRKELYGAEEIQGKATVVFEMLTQRVRKDLMNGRSCVIDATNLSRKRRMSMLMSVSKHATKKTCVVVLASPETCLERNANRERTVPPEVVYKMLCSFETPYYYEGWDSIELVMNGEPYVFPREEAAALSQDNPHHTLTVGKHMEAARDYCIEHGFSAAVCEAAWYHDTGKLYTKRFQNSRGEPTEIAHFYGHENYSAYLYLCEKAGNDPACAAGEDAGDTLYIANLINWHMRPLTAWRYSPGSEDKDRTLMGETMYRDLKHLNQADREAH